MSDFLSDIVIPPPPFERKKEKAYEMVREEDGSVKLVPGVASPTSGAALRARRELETFQKAFQRVEGIHVYRCECQKCLYVWETLSQTPPSTCPACKNSWWFRPKDWRKMRETTPLEGKVPVKKKKGRPKKGKYIKNAEYSVTPERKTRKRPERVEEVPSEPVGEVATVDRPEIVAGEVFDGGPREVETPVPVASPGDYAALVSAALGLEVDSGLGLGQSDDAGGGESIAGETGYRDQNFVIERVDPASVPRFTQTPPPVVPQMPESLRNFDFSPRRLTWEELHPEEAANRAAIEALNRTVPSVPPPPMPIPEPSVQNIVHSPEIVDPNLDPGLARWADNPIDLPVVPFDEEW